MDGTELELQDRIPTPDPAWTVHPTDSQFVEAAFVLDKGPGQAIDLAGITFDFDPG